MILTSILTRKKQQIAMEQAKLPLEELMRQAQSVTSPTRDFTKALTDDTQMALIAEVKKASPSKGVIRPDFNPIEIAKDYEQASVAAISVLTEQHFFLGSDRYLTDIRQIVTVPLLRKDFIIDAYQVYQARVLGADCILLIVAALTKEQLKRFLNLSHSLSMQCLVEVHNQQELELALECEARLIGINNRNLSNFYTTLEVTANLMAYIPQDIVVVSESGISTYDHIAYLRGLGVRAVLVGESLMRAQSIGQQIAKLRGVDCD